MGSNKIILIAIVLVVLLFTGGFALYVFTARKQPVESNQKTNSSSNIQEVEKFIQKSASHITLKSINSSYNYGDYTYTIYSSYNSLSKEEQSYPVILRHTTVAWHPLITPYRDRYELIRDGVPENIVNKIGVLDAQSSE